MVPWFPGLGIQKWVCGEKESFLEARAAAAGACQLISQSDSSIDVYSQLFTSGQREADAAKGPSRSSLHTEKGKTRESADCFPPSLLYSGPLVAKILGSDAFTPVRHMDPIFFFFFFFDPILF